MSAIDIKSRLNEGSGMLAIYLELRHARKHRPINLKIYVLPSQFDGAFVKDHRNSKKLNVEIANSLKIAQDVIDEYKHKQINIDRLKALIKSAIGHEGKTPTLTSFTQTVVDELRNNNQGSYADHLADIVNRFVSWAEQDMPMHEIDYDMVVRYKKFLADSEVGTATISVYLRGIRRIWLRARKDLRLKTDHPFETGVVPTVPVGKKKKAHTDTSIKSLANLAAKNTLPPIQQQCVESRLLQIYLQGIDFVDIACIDKDKDIENGYISFNRFKNRNRVNNPHVLVKIPPEAGAIIDKYNSTKLLPLFEKREPGTRKFKNFGIAVSRYVKAAQKTIGLNGDFGSKAMRHTWLTAADEFEDNEPLKKVAVGHTVKDITQGYILKNQARIDHLNAKVIAHLLK